MDASAQMLPAHYGTCNLEAASISGLNLLRLIIRLLLCKRFNWNSMIFYVKKPLIGNENSFALN